VTLAEDAGGGAVELAALSDELRRGDVVVESARRITPSLEDVFIARMGAAHAEEAEVSA
jgi:hypothetical protein